MLIFSVSFQFQRMLPGRPPTQAQLGASPFSHLSICACHPCRSNPLHPPPCVEHGWRVRGPDTSCASSESLRYNSIHYATLVNASILLFRILIIAYLLIAVSNLLIAGRVHLHVAWQTLHCQNESNNCVSINCAADKHPTQIRNYNTRHCVRFI